MKKHVRWIMCLLLVWGSLFCFYRQSWAESFESHAQTGMDAFRKNDFQTAYDSLLKAFEIAPDHFGVNFYLGRAAFEIRSYEMAVMVFERALIINPGDNRVKLEMARAFQKLGVNDLARKYCNEVLLSDPPETVRRNIERFLAYIDRTEQRHFFRGTVTLGMDWNDNVWSSPADNIIDTNAGSVALTGPASSEIDDIVYSGIVDVTHTYSFPYSRLTWQTRGLGYKALYHKENDLDTLFFSLDTGPDYALKSGVAGVHLTADYMDLDYAKYSDALGIRAFYRHIFAPSLVVTPDIAYRSRSFQTNADRSADNVKFELDTAVAAWETWWNAAVGYERESANDDEYSYDRFILRLSASREISRGWTLYGSYTYYYSDYEGRSDLFDRPRRDHIHTLGCGVKKRLWQSADRRNSLSVSLGYRYTRADANLALYDYDKNIVSSALEYRF